MRCNNPVHNVTDMVSLSLSVFLISVLQMSCLAVRYLNLSNYWRNSSIYFCKCQVLFW